MEFQIGADPELFIGDENGKPFSAHLLIPGTKQRPFKVEGGAMQIDGTALEFNVNPSKTEDEFIENINKVLDRMLKDIELKEPKAQILTLPIVQFDVDYFKKLPGKVKQLGCDPDFNAYTRQPNPMPEPPEGVRTASGHIHIGWTNGKKPGDTEHFDMCVAAVKQLDVALGKTSMYFDAKNAERQKYYGDLGAFRPKPYGVEYRTLSNTWLRDEEIARWVFSQAQWAMKMLTEQKCLYEDDTLPLDPAGLIVALEQMGAPKFPFAAADKLDENDE